MLVLSGCGGGGALRTYYYHAGEHRYYETTSDDILVVSPEGQVADATEAVRERMHGYAVTRNDGQVAWVIYRWRGQRPARAGGIAGVSQCRPLATELLAYGSDPTSKPPSCVMLPIVNTTNWDAQSDDWDMSAYETLSETGGCTPWKGFLMAPDRPFDTDPMWKRRSCWHRLWEVPVGVLTDTFLITFILAISYSSLAG